VDLRDVPSLRPDLRELFGETFTTHLESGTASAAMAKVTLVLVEKLKVEHETNQLKDLLHERFRDGLYREESETIEGQAKIKELIDAVFAEFADLNDVKDVVRNCDRLFGKPLNPGCVPKVRKAFKTLQKQNERKKLAAKLELRLRAIYYDAIDPASVEGIVRSLYGVLGELEDIQFLIKYANRLLPAKSEDIVANEVLAALRALQQDFTQQRAAAVASLAMSLRNVYSHVEPNQLEQLAEAVSAPFSKIDDLKKLAADALEYFPSEFEAAQLDPLAIRSVFQQKKD